jgi:hypothetical protein
VISVEEFQKAQEKYFELSDEELEGMAGGTDLMGAGKVSVVVDFVEGVAIVGLAVLGLAALA